MAIPKNRRLARPSKVKAATTAAQKLADVTKLEACLYAFLQEDVVEGVVIDNWVPRGWKPTTASASGTNRPTRAANNSGVRFQSGQPQLIGWGADNDATVANRWGVVIARSDFTTAPAEYHHIFWGNGFSGNSACRQPYIYFLGTAQKMGVHWYDTDYRAVEVGCSTGTSTWNFMVWYRRAGKLHAIVNGVRGTPVDFRTGAYNGGSANYIGSYHTGVNMPADVWLDCLMMGQSEISDEVADKLVGLAARRCGRLDALVSAGHKYAYTAPRLTEEDFSTRYRHQEGDWTAYQNSGTNGSTDVAPPSGALSTRHQHRGEAEPTHTGFTRVFYDTFASNTVVDNITGDPTSNWFAPIEIAPGNYTPSGQTPAARITDTTAYSVAGGELRLRMYYNGSTWYCAAIGSVNHAGLGRTWAGEQIRRVKYRLATSDSAFPAGIFPAPAWGYNRDYLIWRTRTRLEFDDMEAQGNDASFMNVSLHAHPPTVPGNFTDPTVRVANDFEKLVGYNYTTSRGFSTTLNWWANTGTVFTTATKIEGGMIYGYQQGFETFREVVHPALLEPWSFLITWAFKTGLTPDRNTAHTYDMIIEEVEVYLKTTALAVVPSAGFTARPTISGTLTSGSTLTVTPNAVSTPSSQLTYRWYRTDGTPITGAASNTYVLTAAEVGNGVRVHVVNNGVKDQPEAWTADTANVS